MALGRGITEVVAALIREDGRLCGSFPAARLMRTKHQNKR